MRSACWKKLTDKMCNHRISLKKLLFGLYCLMMLWLLFLRRIPTGMQNAVVNLEPLETIKRYLWVLRHSNNPPQRRYAVANLLGNVGLFLPLGLLLPGIFGKMKKFGPFFLCTAATVSAVELCQLLTALGVCDVDDFILNMLGAMLGWLGWKCIQAIDKKTEKST